jgi:hypothetical protein
MTSPWLLDADPYIELADRPHVRPNRPFWQGDIFDSVPLSLTDKPKAEGPKPKTRETAAMLVGNPCSLHAGGGRLAVMQNVAQVRPLKERERDRFAPPWDGFFQLFPLPSFRDGEVWVADFNVLGSVHFKYLEASRIACLSREGWAAMQCRFAYHTLRMRQSVTDRIEDIRALANEADLWEEWNTTGRDPGEFQGWLEEPCGAEAYAGTKRRELLDFAPDMVASEFR